MEIRPYMEKDFPAMVRIWNKVVQDSEAFPQEGQLDDQTGAALFLLRRPVAALRTAAETL